MQESLELEYLLSWHSKNKESSLNGRYISFDAICPLLERRDMKIQTEKIGSSVNNLPIHTLKFGNGARKILMWSQMHGNESTTTKAIFDLINAFVDPDFFGAQLLGHFSFCIIPMLNPDGAVAYTRENARKVDLNRDAQNLSQPESRVLRAVLNEFKPDFCFNLHGQRTIYGFKSTRKSSVLSFLAPSADEQRSITLSRKRAMEVIGYLSERLGGHLEGHIGRYDDGFNLDCTGDTFMNEGVPTVLFEAGHYPNDYKRETTRSYIFSAIMYALEGITTRREVATSTYFNIPEHEKCFADVVLKNSKRGDIALQFEETLIKGEIHFNAKVMNIGNQDGLLGHREVEFKSLDINELDVDSLKIGDLITL